MPRTSIPELHEKYRDGKPLTMLTAYDAPIARQVDRGGVDMILVGDTAGDNHLGYDDTIPVTMDEALSNTSAVDRAVEDAMVNADLDSTIRDAVGTYVAEVEGREFPAEENVYDPVED